MDFDRILQAANRQMKTLQSREEEIAEEIGAIRKKRTPASPLSAEDKKKLSELREEQDSVVSAIEQLSLLTCKALDETEDIAKIADALDGIAGNLRRTADTFKKIGGTTKTVGDALADMDVLVAKVRKFVKPKAA
jgi:ABC-type transporter Mla subunit MlaD